MSDCDDAEHAHLASVPSLSDHHDELMATANTPRGALHVYPCSAVRAPPHRQRHGGVRQPSGG